MQDATRKHSMSDQDMVIYLHDVARLDKDLDLRAIACRLQELINYKKDSERGN